MVKRSLWWLHVLFFVYLGDILIVGTRRFVRKAVCRARQGLQRVDFVISGKYVLEPAHHLVFVGKLFDLKRGTLENRSGMLRGLVRLWLLLVLGLLNRKGMERLLGPLEWALRPSAGLSPFLVGAYHWKHAGGRSVPRPLLRPLLTVICFAVVPQKHPIKARVQAKPLRAWGSMFFLLMPPLRDETVSMLACTYQLGDIRTFQCPRWVTTLQAAKLWGLVQRVRLVAFMQWPRVCVGSNSAEARYHIQGRRGAVFCIRQQRMLRAVLWVPRWSRIPIAGFYVPSGRNPADPPSRMHEFDTLSSCLGLARDKYRPPSPSRSSLRWPLPHGLAHHVTAQNAPLAFVAVDGAIVTQPSK